MSKKKSISVGTIKGIDLIKATKPIQDISFHTGFYTDKRKKGRRLTKMIQISGYKKGDNLNELGLANRILMRFYFNVYYCNFKEIERKIK